MNQHASVGQSKEELCRQMLFFRNIVEVPSDVSDGGEDTDDGEMSELIDESKENGKEESVSASASATATTNQQVTYLNSV